MPLGTLVANSENMSYPLGQDVIEIVRQSSEKLVWACALSGIEKVLKGKP